MICSNCKKEISKADKFCDYCGTEIILKEKGNEVKVEKRSSKWLWIISGVFLLIVIGFIFYLPLNKYNDFTEKDIIFLRTDKNPSNFEQIGSLYRNKRYNFRIKFPEGWEQKDGDGPNILRKAVYENHSINILVKEIPKEIAIQKFSINDFFNLEEYKQIATQSLKEKFSDVKIIDAGETKIGNQPTYWVYSQASYSVLGITVEMISISYKVFYNNTFYLITIASTKDEFNKIKGVLKRSVATFVFENY